MFEIIFRKVAIVGLTMLVVFMAACSSPAAEVAPTAVPPTPIPPTEIPPTPVPPTTQALLDAINADDLAEVQRLMAAGLDPNLDENGVNPMFVAMVKGNVEVVRLVIEHGDDVMMETAVGTNLLDAATAGAVLTEGQLQMAELLLEHMAAQGWDINQQNPEGWTQVVSAVDRRQFSLAELFIEAGANVDIPNYKEETALLLNAQVGRIEAVRFLVDHGANLDYQDRLGNTPLHLAADDNVFQEEGTTIEVVKILLEAGATPDLQNEAGQTPLDIAVLKGHDEIAQLLQEAVGSTGQ